MASLIVAIISAVIALISVIISIIAIITTKKINKINMKSRYFQIIFDVYLVKKIPEARTYIRFDTNGRLDDFQNLIDVVSEMRNNATFFKYDNKEFFDKLKEKTQNLENYLVDCSNKQTDNEEQADIYSEIAKKTTEIYGCISDYYMGLK